MQGRCQRILAVIQPGQLASLAKLIEFDGNFAAIRAADRCEDLAEILRAGLQGLADAGIGDGGDDPGDARPLEARKSVV